VSEGQLDKSEGQSDATERQPDMSAGWPEASEGQRDMSVGQPDKSVGRTVSPNSGGVATGQLVLDWGGAGCALTVLEPAAVCNGNAASREALAAAQRSSHSSLHFLSRSETTKLNLRTRDSNRLAKQGSHQGRMLDNSSAASSITARSRKTMLEETKVPQCGRISASAISIVLVAALDHLIMLALQVEGEAGEPGGIGEMGVGAPPPPTGTCVDPVEAQSVEGGTETSWLEMGRGGLSLGAASDGFGTSALGRRPERLVHTAFTRLMWVLMSTASRGSQCWTASRRSHNIRLAR
jgi:hypothetical protein